MTSDETRRVEAEGYIRAAVQLLELAQSRYLDHTDGTIVKDAIQGLGIVRRSMAASVPVNVKIAARLRDLATRVQLCVEPGARAAHLDITRAAGIFQTMVDACDA